MSYTERACAIDLSLRSLLQRHSIKETSADIWRAFSQRLRKYMLMAVHTKTHRRRFHFGERFRIYAFTSVCVYNPLRVDGAQVLLNFKYFNMKIIISILLYLQNWTIIWTLLTMSLSFTIVKPYRGLRFNSMKKKIKTAKYYVIETREWIEDFQNCKVHLEFICLVIQALLSFCSHVHLQLASVEKGGPKK